MEFCKVPLCSRCSVHPADTLKAATLPFPWEMRWLLWDRMPPTGPLKAEEIAIFKKWIDEGAP